MVKEYEDGHKSFLPWYGTDRRSQELQHETMSVAEFEQIDSDDDYEKNDFPYPLVFPLYSRSDIGNLPSNLDLQKLYLNLYFNHSSLFQESGIKLAKIAYLVFNFKFLLTNYHTQSKLFREEKKSF